MNIQTWKVPVKLKTWKLTSVQEIKLIQKEGFKDVFKTESFIHGLSVCVVVPRLLVWKLGIQTARPLSEIRRTRRGSDFPLLCRFWSIYICTMRYLWGWNLSFGTQDSFMTLTPEAIFSSIFSAWLHWLHPVPGGQVGNFSFVFHGLQIWGPFRFPAFGLGCSVHMKYLHDCFVC